MTTAYINTTARIFFVEKGSSTVVDIIEGPGGKRA